MLSLTRSIFPAASGTRWLAIFLVCGVTGFGCEPPKAKQETAATPARPVDAVLDRMLTAYRDAKSYSDEGLITIKIDSTMGKNMGDFDAKLEFVRPNMLRMEFQPPVWMETDLSQRLIVSDGKKVYAQSDPYEKQVMVADAPQANVADALFESKVLGPLLTDEIIGGSLVLRLLASAKLPDGLDRAKAELLKNEALDGHECQRVQFVSENGNLILWIDAKSALVRRIEFPTAKLLKDLSEQGMTALEVTHDLNKAQLNPTIAPQRFTWKKGDDEFQVREFVEPPSGAHATPKLVGQPVPEFQFTTPGGEKRAAASLSGKVTVIDFWATWCVWCLKGMPAVEEVRKKYAGNDKVQFLALSQDEADVTDEQIVATLKRIKADPPWARLAGQTGDELNAKFQFEGIPALVVLGADGRVQYVHVGYDPKLVETLPPIIDGLLAGKDPSALAIEAREAKIRDYRRQLEAARIDAPKK